MSTNLRIFNTLFTAVFVTTMGAGIVAPLLPVYAHTLGAGAFQIGLIFAAFSLSRTLFVPYFGKLSDRKGKKPLLTSGLLLYFALSLLYTLTDRVETLIFLRLGQGFASAMILPVAHAYVGLITPAHKEGRIMGIFNISLFGGLSVGPILGGVVKDWVGIQFSFLSMGALSLFGFALCLLLLPREPTSAGGRPKASKDTLSYSALLKRPSILALFTFRSCFTLCIGITWTFLPFLASTRLGLSSSTIGVVVMINVLVAGLFQAPMGFLADRFSKRLLVAAGGVLGVFSILYLNMAVSFGGLLFGNALLGVAGGVSFPAIMALGVIEGRSAGGMGSIMGLLAMAHSLGMLLGPLLAGVLIDLFSLGSIFVFGAIVMTTGTVIFLIDR